MNVIERYRQAREDYGYLWRYAPADDTDNYYSDMELPENFMRMLESPGRKTAAACYEGLIYLWLCSGPDRDLEDESWKHDPKIRQIAERYGYTNELDQLLDGYV